VVRDQDVALGGFGRTGPQTSFQIGSLTKVFTALLLADMTERGQVRLSDPAAMYLPGGERGTEPVTLAALATHTSGLPRLPRNGMTGGFSSMIALDPARRLGVAALANSAGNRLPAGRPRLGGPSPGALARCI
jgi:CubicO group peptidase (beta-lactamase class C family)